MVVFVYVCLLFASSLCLLFAVTVITTSYFSVGFLLPPVFCVCFSLFFMLQRKKEMKKKVRSTRRGSLWKFNVNTAPITCDQWFVYPELLFPPMKDSCDSLTGFGSLLLIFFGLIWRSSMFWMATHLVSTLKGENKVVVSYYLSFSG